VSRIRTAAAVAALAAAAAALVWYARQPHPVTAAIALLDRLDEADRRTSAHTPDQFTVADVALDGETRRAILARPHARLTWRVAVPPGARLDLAVAVAPDGPDAAGGALFRVSVSDGPQYAELLRRHVDPGRGDRGWLAASIDLSSWAGRTVDLVLNTDPAPDYTGTTRSPALWGEPRIISR
jgi:hypothetical protein